MTPEEIRALYEREEAATDEEAAATLEEVLSNPELARAHFATLFALVPTNEAIATLVGGFLGRALVKLVERHMAADDEFALECGRLIIEVMDDLSRQPPEPPKTPRGKPRAAKTA